MMASMNSPLLTICIPSYNRGKRVYSLVLYLLEHVVSKHTRVIELLVTNNCSTDDTLELLAPLQAHGLRLVTHAQHLPSAEANMFASVALCQGRFIWFHGDDDIPVPDTVELLIKTLLADDVDMLISNSASIDMDGVMITDRLLKMNHSHVDLTSGDIVFAAGFLHILAGISGVVFRKAMADVALARSISEVQEIYAHVVWLLRCFSRARVRILGQPLVYYRTDDPRKTLRHFEKYARTKGIGDHSVWSFGLIRLLNILLESGDLRAADIGRIYDGRRDGTRFRLVDQIIHQLYLQVRASRSDASTRNRVSDEMLRQAMSFLFKVDLFSFDTLSLLQAILTIQNRNPGFKGVFVRRELARLYKQFEKTYFAQLSENYYRPLRIGRSVNYTIYRTPVGFVALSEAAHAWREQVLSFLDPMEVYPEILVDATLEALHHKVAQVVASQQLLAGDEAVSGAPKKSLESTLLRITEDLHAIRSVNQELVGLRAQEMEIARQSSYLLRLLTYRPLLPLRHAWFSLQELWGRIL